MRLDTVIRGGTVVLPSGSFRLDLGIKDGVVSCLAKPGDLETAENEIDATGKWVLPGVVDSHVHLRDPG